MYVAWAAGMARRLLDDHDSEDKRFASLAPFLVDEFDPTEQDRILAEQLELAEREAVLLRALAEKKEALRRSMAEIELVTQSTSDIITRLETENLQLSSSSALPPISEQPEDESVVRSIFTELYDRDVSSGGLNPTQTGKIAQESRASACKGSFDEM